MLNNNHLEDLENLCFHNNQTPEQLKVLDAIRTTIEELVNKDPQLALEKSEEYLTLAKKYLHQEHVANFLYLYGALHYFTGKNTDALKICKIAHNNTNDIELSYKIQTLFGAIFTYFGNFDKALESYNNALKTNNSASSSTVYNNIAIIYFKQKEYVLAIEYLNKALILSESDQNLVLAILNNIGRSYIELKELNNAETILIKVIELLEVVENPTQEMINNLNIGLLYFKQERFQDAYSKLLNAYLKCKELDLKNNLYSATLFLAHACSKNHKIDQANTYYLETLDLVRDLDKRQYSSTLKDYIDFLVSQNDFEKCITYFIEYDQLKDEIIKEDKEKEISALTVKFQNTEQKLEIEKLHKEKEFQKQLIDQAESIRISNEKLTKLNHILYEANNQLMETKILRAQMNPHFIYNTLNSISSLIKTKRNKEAVAYLQNFSILTHQIFDKKTNQEILLQEELDFCYRYLSLEKLRFGDKFHFECIMDKKIDPKKTIMPSMLLQPLIENSLKHGVFHLAKSIKGKITLHIRLQKKYILFDLIDNGIGLHSTNKALSNQERESSLVILNKRINIFNNKKLNCPSLKIINNIHSGITNSFRLNYKTNSL